MAANQDPVEKISSSKSIKGANKIADAQEAPENRVAPNQDKFLNALKLENTNAVGKAEQQTKVSLMDEISALNRKVENAPKADPQQLAIQSKEVIAQIEELKNRLTDPHVEIKNDYKQILRNKLEHVDESLKIALDKAGVEYVAPIAAEQSGNTPIERFMNLLTQGQEQLGQLGGQLQKLGNTRENINPANLLMVQMKVNYIQQELEFFTSVLNKALEGTKTIMNVQV